MRAVAEGLIQPTAGFEHHVNTGDHSQREGAIMNLVEIIKNQLNTEVIAELGSLIGVSPEKVGTALSAALPAILAGIGQLTSSAGGAEKVVHALRQVDSSPSVDLGSMFKGGDTGSLATKGEELLGGGALTATLALLSKYAGIDLGSVRKLVSMLTPVILSAIAGELQGSGLSAQGLRSLMEGQKLNISAALPAGFTLPDFPGLAGAGGAAGTSWGKYLLALAGTVLFGVLAWNFLGSGKPTEEGVPEIVEGPRVVGAGRSGGPVESPVLPDASALSADLAKYLTSATEDLESVKDDATATAALPKLAELESKLTVLKAFWEKLPDAGKATIKTLVTGKLAALKELAGKVLAIPGVGEKLKPGVDAILAELAALAA